MVNSMGRLGEWDKVPKKREPFKYTRSDELWDYFKLFLMVAVGYLYIHFVIMGW
tara:strand:- start:1058 stop:1219 length:162 start_codon:yes stop_codon:yes gene_type:complete